MFAGGLNPEHVLDDMEPYEIEIALAGIYYKNKDSWEQTRQILYVIAQVNSKDRINPKSILPFPWDTEGVEDDDEYTEEERRKIEEMMDNIVKEKNNGSRSSNEALAR